MNAQRVAALSAVLICGAPIVRAQPIAPPPPPATPAAGARPAPGERSVTLAPVRPGNYTCWTVPAGAAGMTTLTPDSGTAKIALPRDTRALHVLNDADGTLAVLPAAKWKSGETVVVAPQDFKYVRALGVTVTAAGGKPVAAAVVTLKDAAGRQTQRALTAGDAGRAEFGEVAIGRATLTAVSGANGVKTTQELTVAPGAGGTAPAAALTLSGNVPTVEASPSAAGTEAKPGSAPPALPGGPAETAPRESGSSWLAGVAGLALLAGLGWYAVRTLRARGVTVADALQRIGVEMPQDAAAEMAAPLKPAVPAVNLPPLASLADLPAAGPAAAVPAFPVMSSAPGGPRLISLAGPVNDTLALDAAAGPVSIGRDPASTVALTSDTTASRQHARVESRGGGWVVVDAGSRNGTFVNGARVQGEQPLHPGDEITVGAARFRFEA